MNRFHLFHFLRPDWLWLLPIAALLYFLVFRRQDVSKRWERMIAPNLLKHLLIGERRRLRFRPVHATCIAVALGAIALAGPTWDREKPPFTEDKAPLVIAVDLSPEMDAIDVPPSRLERAKLKIADILKIRRGSRTAIFVYSSTAHMVLPLTSDESLINLYAQSLSSDLLPPGIKQTGAALRKIDAFLKNEAVPGTILFITSGVERSAFSAFEGRHDSRNQALVLAIGTPDGGPIRLPSGGFLTESGRRVFTKLNVSELKAFKAETGVPVSVSTLDNSDVEWIQRRALTHLHDLEERGAEVRWIDEGYWLVIPVALMGALWFRKGWTIRWSSAVLALFLALHAPNAQAAGFFDLHDFRFIDLWMTPDQQGRYYFEKGDYPAAARHFADPMWKGLALARSGDCAAALDQFALVDTPESWYNQGNCLVGVKKYPDAVNAYTEALRGRPDWREALENLALVRSLIPPSPKPKEQRDQYDPSLKPDQIKFDEKGKKGKKGLVSFGKEQMAEVWMRNIQTSPADFLRRKFAIENATEEKR